MSRRWLAAAVLAAGCTGPQVADLPPLALDPPVTAAAHTQPATPPPPPPRDAPPLAASPASVGGPLPLAEVLDAVERTYPLLRAAEQERAIAGGRLLSSLGAFDLTLSAGVDGQGGTYDNVRPAAGLSQGLPVGGLGVFAGYRNGGGDFPTYNLGQKTADGGELRAGVSVPLLRDRAIDRPRATVQQARLDVRLAEPVIDRQRLDFQRAAARTYWNWVAAGHRLRLVEELARLADDRDGQLAAQVKAGRIARFERLDNQQNIALRNGLLVQAQRGVQQATIELSLFLRDGAGTPTLAGRDRLPDFPPVLPVDPAGLAAALQVAAELRPEPRRLRLQRERLAVDLRLADNQTLPGLTAVVSGSQDVGPGRSSLSGPNGLDRATLSAGVALAVPLQRREARGRVVTAQAQIVQVDQLLKQAEDVVRADVQDAFSALERAAEFHRQAEARVGLAREVADGERERLRGGTGSVLAVTLREQAAFDAELTAVAARQDYFRAAADLRAAAGQSGPPAP